MRPRSRDPRCSGISCRTSRVSRPRVSYGLFRSARWNANLVTDGTRATGGRRGGSLRLPPPAPPRPPPRPPPPPSPQGPPRVPPGPPRRGLRRRGDEAGEPRDRLQVTVLRKPSETERIQRVAREQAQVAVHAAEGARVAVMEEVALVDRLEHETT